MPADERILFIATSHYRMKVLLFKLVRTFRFELAVPVEDVEPFGVLLQRPRLRSDPDRGPQLPILVQPL